METVIRELSVEDSVNQIIKGEIKELVSYRGAPYVKFLLLATAIEFIGACLDKHPFEKEELSKKRFNTALRKLFPKQRHYKKYGKKGVKFNLYENLRCGMVHKFKPSKFIRLTERRHLSHGKSLHLTEINGSLILVLEDLYEDLEIACDNLLKLESKGRLPSKKMKDKFIQISQISSINLSGDTPDDSAVIT